MRSPMVLGFTRVALFALVAGHGIAAAQAQGPPAGVVRQVDLSPPEQLAQSEGMLVRMDASRGVVRRQLEGARAARDVVRTLCLNDKLNQLDVAIRSARERRQSIEAAVRRSDGDLSGHEFTILSVLRQRSDQLTMEANQCVGGDPSPLVEAAVTSTVDPGLPREDPWQSPVTSVITEPPTCASCIK